MCVVCSKVNFITNIINSIRIHTFYFYNNKHTFINTDTICITKHTNFIKINTDPMTVLSIPLYTNLIKPFSSFGTHEPLYTCTVHCFAQIILLYVPLTYQSQRTFLTSYMD
jgi:hypothetical protein